MIPSFLSKSPMKLVNIYIVFLFFCMQNMIHFQTESNLGPFKKLKNEKKNHFGGNSVFFHFNLVNKIISLLKNTSLSNYLIVV